MSLPMVSRGDSNPMFESATSNLVLFQARNSTEANRRYVALLMDIPSNQTP